MSPSAGTTLGALAKAVGAELRRGEPGAPVDGVGALEDARATQVSFYANPAYRKQLAPSRAAAVIVSQADADMPELRTRPVLVAANAYATFARASQYFHPQRSYPEGIDPRAHVEPGAAVDSTAHVAPFAVVRAGAVVGAGAAVMSFAYVGEGASVGAGTVLWPHAVVRDGCVVGARCILHPGAVVGADGFGFAFDAEGDGAGPVHRKIPQAGIARLEDDVELGANSCVDRAALGETVVGRGTKIDNQVQLGHGVRVGPLCVIASQAGVAGSTTIGAGVAVGGQAGIVGHLAVGDLARVGARAAVMQDVEAGATVMGWPATDAKVWKRAAMSQARVPELIKELRELRRRVDELERARAKGEG